MNHPIVLTVACFSALVSSANAELRMPSIFSDHMVIQRDRPVEVWGWSDPGSRIQVLLSTHETKPSESFNSRTTADTEGRWSVELPSVTTRNENRGEKRRDVEWRLTITEHSGSRPAPEMIVNVEAGGISMIERDGQTTHLDKVIITDVLVGEVWICGGQSNMEWTLDQIGDDDTPPQPRIRLIKAPHVLATEPQKDIDTRWEVCNEQTLGRWSAVGFFFGETLLNELDVPIGLISTNWGGTRIEPWIQRADLAAHPTFAERTIALQQEIATYKSISEAERLQRRDSISRRRETRATRYWTEIMDRDPGKTGGWMNPEFDDDGWATMDLPAEWESAEPTMKTFDGTVWFRRTIEIPRSWRDKTLVLELGRIDDSDRTYVNGRLIGSSTNLHNKIRRYEVPPEAIGKGSVTIAVCVMDPHGAGGFTGPRMTLSPQGEDVEGVDLTGSWRWSRGQASTRTTSLENETMRPPGMTPQSPGTLNDAMIAPFVPYGVQGAIWYQGESNSSQADEYRALLPLLIESWREDFGSHLAFGIVQLAAFKQASDDPDQGGWADLRDAQLHAFQTVDGTGLAVTTDVGDANDIHPRRKQPVGERLGWWALHDVYGMTSFTPSGPIATKAVARGGTVTVTFAHDAEGLTVHGLERPANERSEADAERAPDGFALAGDDGVFHWAEARFKGSNEIELSSNEVPAPRIVSYGWQDNPVRTNVINSAGLPASPFKIPVE